MRNISVKIPWAEKAESDLEEGEIPEFELPSSASDKEGMVLFPQKIQSLTLLNPHEKIKKETGKRYDSPPSEGEYISEEEKLVKSNKILQADTYQNNLMGKVPKNIYPIQTTYGSVEDIMTKIGESLGRNSSYYYKGRRLKESRYLFSVNDARDINPVLMETSPIVKRFGYNYYSRSRCNETNSDSVDNIGGKYGKVKSKKLLDTRRTGKDVTKKRKREHGKINGGDVDKSKAAKKVRFLEKKERGCYEWNRKEKKHGIDTRIFKEIPLPQEQEAEENVITESTRSDDSNCPPDKLKDRLSNEVACSNFVHSPSTISWDDRSKSRNSTDKSEQLNGDDDDDDDNDDDLELIKLRLLALTSNKKKTQSTSNDSCLDNVEDLKICTEENVTGDSKPEFGDNNKAEEKPSRSDETVKEHQFNNEIDRYELFLRAEALKTALLKKHQRILKKRRNFNAISRGRPVFERDSTSESKLVKRNDTDIISDEELFEESRRSDLDVQMAVTQNSKKTEIDDDKNSLEINNVNKLNSGSNKEGVTTDVHREDDLHSNNLATSVIMDNSEEYLTGRSSSESGKALNSMKSKLKDASTGYQYGKKKAKRTRLKRIKKSRDLGESNVRENDLICEEKDMDQKTKSRFCIGLNDKNIMEPEKKIILTGSSTSSNCEISNSIISNTQLSLDKKKNDKSTITEKPSSTSNEEAAAKIPDTERIIVHLGSESSDEEFVPECNLDKKSDTILKVDSIQVRPVVSVDNQTKIKEFEKSVELLLKGARRKIEKKAEITSQIPSTPEAVYSHLAPSQRLEYIRLKQKIAEREKLRNAEKNNFNSAPASEESKRRVNSVEYKRNSQINIQKNVGINCYPVDGQNIRENNKLTFKTRLTHREIKHSSDKNNPKCTTNYNVLGNNKSGRVVVNQVLNIKKPAVEPNSQIGTLNILKNNCSDYNSKNMVKKGSSTEKSMIERKKMLTQNRLHLERLKILWKNIKIEKMIEAKYEREIKKLKIQQNFFELKINQQRLKIKKLADESKQIYEVFQKNNKRVEVCNKKKKVSVKPGRADEIKVGDSENDTKEIVLEKDVKEEVIPDRVENDVHLVAKDTEGGVFEKKEDIKVNVEKKCSEKMVVTLADKDNLKEYNSPLQILADRSESLDCPRVDPNVIMCQYDLLGKCNDEECIYQHWRA